MDILLEKALHFFKLRLGVVQWDLLFLSFWTETCEVPTPGSRRKTGSRATSVSRKRLRSST